MELAVADRPSVSSLPMNKPEVEPSAIQPQWNIPQWALPTPDWDWHSTVIFIGFWLIIGYICWVQRASLRSIINWILYALHIRVRSSRVQAEIEMSVLNRSFTASVAASSFETPEAECEEHTAIDMGQILDNDDHYHDCQE